MRISLDELIDRIYENKKSLIEDECRYSLICGKRKQKLIRSEGWNHEIDGLVKLFEKENEDSHLCSYLLENGDFAKTLFFKELNGTAKKEMRKHIKNEVTQIKDTFNTLYRLYGSSKKIALSQILGILKNVDDYAQLRFNPVIIRGGRYVPPESYYEIENELRRFEDEILNNEGIPEIKKAFHIHYQFVRIHPLRDGNGRSARVWSNAYLYHKSIFPIIIPLGERDWYAELLDKACLSHRRNKKLTYLTSEEKELFKYFAIKINNEYEKYFTQRLMRIIK